MRRDSSTVVVLVGEVPAPLLTELARSPNVSLVRPPEEEQDGLTAAATALGQAAHRASPFVLVTADPLAEVAAQWRAMWDLSAGPRGPAGFEARAAEALSAWRAGRFEFPDYYLVLAPVRTSAARTSAARNSAPGNTAARNSAARNSAARNSGTGPDLYLGPLRAARPRRVEAVVTADEDGQASQVLQALRALQHGPWWPPLDELIDTARRFFAGGLAEGEGTLAAPTISPPGKPGG